VTTRVLIVNHGPQAVAVDTYRKRNAVIGVFVGDPIVKSEEVPAHQELSCLVYAGQYIAVREV
jgi:hypothetical protein